ncbi:MAG: beta-lactamase family protein, partial [Verrucomicrobiae bacterium]|nr:beta-lactamase family protein [Verrucomicrobiae bacterium]
MKRRSFLHHTGGLAACGTTSVFAALKRDGLEAAGDILRVATASGQISAASLYVSQGDTVFGQAFGTGASVDDCIFLLASISKTISTAALMTLFDQGKFALDDPVAKFIPEFTGEGREKITVRQLLTHVSGLPDQLPENAKLRASRAPLSAFVEAAIRTPLLFAPGDRYNYSSMAILLATEVAQRISGKPFATLVDEAIYQPLEMKYSAMGVGRLDPA